MKLEKAGTEHTLFYDTYALYAIVLGQENYKQYTANIKVITTIMNLYELYHRLMQENLGIEAEKFFERFLPFCIDIEPHIIKEAARFRIMNSKLKLSYIDCLGYIIAQHNGARFLTGDEGFKTLPNVLFVK